MRFISSQACAIAVVLISISTSAFAQYSSLTLKSFGFTNLAATHPHWPPIEAIAELNNVYYSIGLYGNTEDGGIHGQGTLYRMATNGAGFEVVHHFKGWPVDGATPGSPLIELNPSLLVGVTTYGGANNLGTIFSYNAISSNNYSIIHHFTGTASDGAYPTGSLVGLLDVSGPRIFGVTMNGGSHGFGCVYRINHDGGQLTILKSFTNGLDGGFPMGGITIGPRLYGTTRNGGTLNEGVLYSMELDGSAFVSFFNFGGDIGSPSGPIVAAGGFLYGMTTYGGTSGQGMIYRVRPTGSEFSVVKSFNGTSDGAFPNDGLFLNTDGFLYGTTRAGGFQNSGIFFRFEVANNANFQILTPFVTLGNGGTVPFSSVSRTLAATLFGAASQGGQSGQGTIYASLTQLSNTRFYQTFWHFSETGGDVSGPVSPLLLSGDGWLYGVAPAGGAFGGGGIYRSSKTADISSVIWSFGSAAHNVRHPAGGLLEATDGLFYGVARFGGLADVGAVFSISRQGTNLVSLKSFDQPAVEGAEPNSALIEGRDGLLYGTTVAGGTADLGTAFRLGKNGTNFAVIHHWTGGANDGAQPNGVIEAADGFLYGTARGGGGNNLGVIFKMQRDGGDFTILHHCSASDGYQPQAGLIEASDGVLYGTTRLGGSEGAGTVFKIGKDGSGFVAIKNFSASTGDGEFPVCALVEGSDRGLYGVSSGGGNFGYGVVFRVTRDGLNSSVIASFSPLSPGGDSPSAGLVKDPDGSLFGSTEQGGVMGKGTLFRLVPTWANHPPQLANPVGTRTIAWAAQTTFGLAPNTFSENDAGQVLSYAATGFPSGLNFSGPTRTFSGVATNIGSHIVTVVATDNGSPALSAVDKFQLNVAVVPPKLSASHSGGLAELTLQATNGQTVLVELSTNLFNWFPVSTNTIVVPPLFLSDPSASSRAQSFYRARIQP